MKKLDYIDSLRAIAIIGVILVHTFGYVSFEHPGNIAKMISCGHTGVQLFFVASAFTLFLSFSNRSNNEKFPLRNFFIRRFFRIAPMYYIGITYYLIQDGLGPRYWLGDVTHVSNLNIVSNFTFLSGFNPYWINSIMPGGWSIAVEMLFYVVLPLIFYKVKNINHALYFLIFSIALNFGLHVMLSRFPLIGFNRLWEEYLALYFPSQLPVFAFGIIMFFIIIKNQALQDVSGTPLLLLTVIIFLYLSTDLKVILPVYLLFGAGFMLLGVALSKHPVKILVNPFVNYIGKISFSLYIVHFAVLYWLSKFELFQHQANDSINFFMFLFIVVMCVSVLVSTLFYKVVEVPFQNLAKSIIRKWENNQRND